jgi:hypothetical protein
MGLTEADGIQRLYKQWQYETKYMRVKWTREKGKMERGDEGMRKLPLEDRPGDEPPSGSAVFKDLCEATGRRKGLNRRNHERVHIPSNRNVSLSTILHAFGVRDVPAGAYNRDFPFPDNLRDGKDGAVDIGLGVPVAGNQKHIFADVNARFMNAEGGSGPIELAFHVDVTNVGGGFVDRDVRVESDYLTTRPEWPKLIAFDKSPGLFLCKPRDGERKCLRDVRLDLVVVSVPRA